MTDSEPEQQQQAPVLSVVIPVYNEGANILELVKVTTHTLASAEERFEIILIDDGSQDDTWVQIDSLQASVNELRALRLSRNFGKEAAVAAGLENARGEGVIIMDGDLQHPPSLLPEMIAKWKTGDVEIVEAVKSQRGDEPLVNRYGSKVFYSLLNRLADQELNNATDFKLIDRSVLEAWLSMGERNLFFRGMIAWLGFRRETVYFDVPERTGGQSSWTFLTLAKLATTAITAFSSAPLQIVTTLGIVFFLFAFLLALQTLYNWLTGFAVSGFTSVILLILMIGGLQMVCLGILGTYLARVYEEVKSRPRFVIRERR
ncbi:MAG: glycosyltransferase family 2 protein [Pseudomonadota bacterium]